MNNLRNLPASFLIILAACNPNGAVNDTEAAGLTTADTQLEIQLQLVKSNLQAPIGLENAGDGTGRLFVFLQKGVIEIIENGEMLSSPFMDLTDRVMSLNAFYDERGLLGLAFHPSYKTNGRFFVHYSAISKVRGSNHKGVLSEFKVSGTDPNKADMNSEKILMTIEQPEMNHDGGQIAFGPDGYLYFGLGDGGGGGDKHGEVGNGQDLSNFLGKILRIDVDGKKPYEVPSDNPFVGKEGRDEIWAYGLRNPWRFSFDPLSGQLFCADVGQNKYEEVDIIEKGKNYGWRIMEGNHCFDPKSGCDTAGLAMPIDEYDHDLGISVTGGYVYQGKKYPSLKGKYVYADWKGPMLYLEQKGSEWVRKEFRIFGRSGSNIGAYINSFGIDEDGEIYIITQKGTGPKKKTGAVYRIKIK